MDRTFKYALGSNNVSWLPYFMNIPPAYNHYSYNPRYHTGYEVNEQQYFWPGESVLTEASTGVPLVIMTSDRPTGQPLVAPSSTNNLNPTAPVFCQGRQDKGPQSSFSADVSERDFNEALTLGQPLTNGDVHAASTSAGNYFGSSRGWVGQPFQPRMPQGAQSPAVLGMNMGHASVVNTGGPTSQNGHQPYPLGMPVESMANTHQQPGHKPSYPSPDGAGGEPTNGQNSSQTEGPGGGDREVDVVSSSGNQGGTEGDASEEELQYPEPVIAPIRKQLEYYFSQENLPHDKYLNTHMDINKYVPLRLFPDFNRMKPICSSIDQLVQAVQTSSLLELNDDKTKVRISQTRKTLTLRGLPPKATPEDIHKLLKENECPPAMHIEVIMVHTVSNWYVSFSTEAQCMEAFFKLHNSKVTVDGYPIGCCIKSSGTHVATGYFPSQEDHPQRRMPQSQANVTPTVQGSITQQPAMQQPPALMQQYNPVQLHPSLMAPAGQSLYFSQGAQYALNMPYMPGMITQSWPGTTGLDPGLVSIDAICMAYRQRRALTQQMLQSSGLQPQHIRTSLPRPMVQGTASHRFTRPQRLGSRQNMDRSSVSVSGSSSRNSPAGGMDGSISGNIVPHNASHMNRRSNMREEIAVTQHAASHHQFVTPIVTQHQVTGVPTSTTIVNPSVMENVNNTATLTHAAVNVASHSMPQQPHQPQQQPHSHPQSVLLQHTTLSGSNPPTSNPLPQPHQHQHHHHPHQPPPQIPHQLSQSHQQQQQPQHSAHQHQQQTHHHHSHHHSMGNSHHGQQHIGSHQQQAPPPPPSAAHQHQPSLATSHHGQAGHHHHHQHPPHHHHHHHHQHHAIMPSQHHNQPPPNERRSIVMAPQQPPPQPHHHQQSVPLTNRRNRRRRDEPTSRNQRDRNVGNRTNFSSQTPVPADNFTMEANSFPPLPGAANAPSSEIAPENRMMHSDIVKGISRVPALGSGAPLPVRANSSSTPSPVATPTLTPSHVPSTGPAIVDIRGGEEIDPVVDDDTTSSSQEDAEVDIGNAESTNRPSRCEVAMPASGEGPSVQAQARHVKGSTTVVPPNSSSNVRQGHHLAQAKVQQAMPLPQQSAAQQPTITPLMAHGNSVPSTEAPKLSYAQILLAKREAANNATAESNASAVTTPSTNSSNSITSGNTTAMNGPASNPPGVMPPGQPNSGRSGQSSNNAFRDQGNYPPNSGHRPQSHRSPKDGQPRPDGSQSRMPNGRRNSKETRTQGNAKFDRKKPEGRSK